MVNNDHKSLLEKSFIESCKEPRLRFIYFFFISLLLPLIANLLSGQDISGSGYLEISYGYFIFYSIIVFLCYICVYLSLIKGYTIFRYGLYFLFFICVIAQYQYITYALTIHNYSIQGIPSILNLVASFTAIISALLKFYCLYLLFNYKIYLWRQPAAQ